EFPVQNPEEVKRYIYAPALSSRVLKLICEEVSEAAGSVNWKTAPWGELEVAQRRPPWDSMIVRLIARPMPIPSGFVVKKASNTRSRFAGSSPSPVSRTVTIRLFD